MISEEDGFCVSLRERLGQFDNVSVSLCESGECLAHFLCCRQPLIHL